MRRSSVPAIVAVPTTRSPCLDVEVGHGPAHGRVDGRLGELLPGLLRVGLRAADARLRASDAGLGGGDARVERREPRLRGLHGRARLLEGASGGLQLHLAPEPLVEQRLLALHRALRPVALRTSPARCRPGSARARRRPGPRRRGQPPRRSGPRATPATACAAARRTSRDGCGAGAARARPGRPPSTPRKMTSPETSGEMGTSLSAATVPEAVTVCVMARTRASAVSTSTPSSPLPPKTTSDDDEQHDSCAEADQDLLRWAHEERAYVGAAASGARTARGGRQRLRGVR